MPKSKGGPVGPLIVLFASLAILATCRGADSSLAAEPKPGASQATAGPARVTTAHEFWDIPEAERDRPHRIDMEITANYYDPYWKLLWGTDRSGDFYYPLLDTTPRLRSGQRFKVSGDCIPSKGLALATAKIDILSDTSTVEPVQAKGHFDDVARLNGRLITVRAYVNSQAEADPNHLHLQLAVEGYTAEAYVLIGDNSPIPQVEGALVRLTAVYVCNNDVRPPQPTLWVPNSEDLVVEGWLDRDPRFAAPVTPIDQLPGALGSALVHVLGYVASQTLGQTVVLRDETGEVTVHTAMTRPLAPGAPVEAIGYPGVDGLKTILREGLYRPTSGGAAPSASRGLPMLRLAEQVRRLSAEDAERGFSARLFGVITWSAPDRRTAYLQDGSGGVAIVLPASLTEVPPPGTRVDVTGKSVPGPFAPQLRVETIRLLDRIALPAALPVTLEQALTGVEEGEWISLTGYARTVRQVGALDYVDVSTPAGDFSAVVPPGPRVDALAGTVIQLKGVCRATLDDHGQLTGIELWVPNDESISILEPKPRDPFAEPLRSVTSLRRFNTLNSLNLRVRLAGVVVYQEPGVYFYLQDGDQSLQVLCGTPTVLQPGDRVEVVGFPGRRGQRLILREALVRKIASAAEPEPLAVTTAGALRPELDGRLVRVDASIAEVGRYAKGSRLVCRAQSALFEAFVNLPLAGLPPALAPGSEARLTGVYVVQFDQNGHARNFQLQLRSAGDIAIVQAAPWWTIRKITALVGALFLAGLLALGWVVALRRRVSRQTNQIRDQLEKSARLEAELARSSRLESLGVLAGGIAHDFNNLLTVILGNLTLVTMARKIDEEDQEFLRESERAALRARDLTQQLLTFSKGGAPIRAAVLLPDVVREAARFALHGSPVRGDFDFASDLWPADVDRGQVSQVVHNIAINAVHAMPAGGTLRLTLRNEEIAAGVPLPLQPGRYLKLSIRDTGIGISPEHLSRIFDPFFTTKQQGSGLGLATVYSIVKKHGGHIDVESRLGQGTVFHIWLPAAATAPQTSVPAEEKIPELSGRVLVMDDEAPVRDMASAMLRRLGLEVTTARDGNQALALYQLGLEEGRPFSIVILDLTVPGGMGGREALTHLRNLDPAVRAIVSSGYSNDPVVAQHREHGFQGRVPKPYEFGQFAKVVAAVLEQSQRLEDQVVMSDQERPA